MDKKELLERRHYNMLFIGNGFDLHFGLKTKYSDYIGHFESDENAPSKNTILDYLSVIDKSRIRTWIDFEEELSQFINFIEKLRVLVEFQSIDETFKSLPSGLYLSREKVVASVSEDSMFTYVYNNSKFTRIAQYVDSKIMVDINTFEQWEFMLIEDFYEFKEHFKNYIGKINMQIKSKTKTLVVNIHKYNVLLDICLSNEIANFNYTNTALEMYDNFIPRIALEHTKNHDHKFMHGDCSSEIILGIGSQNKNYTTLSSNFYKSTQLIKYNNSDLKLLGTSYKFQKIFFTFIGLSFGKSDHYLFSKMRSLLDNPNTYKRCYIRVYKYDEKSYLEFINNLRIFLGDDFLMKLWADKKIITEEWVSSK